MQGPDLRALFPNAEKASKQVLELGTLDRSNLSNEELALYESRALGWEYMVNFDKMDEAIGRYASNKAKKLHLSGGGMEGWYILGAKDVADNMASILMASKVTKPPFSHVDLMGTSGGKFYIAKDSEEALSLQRSAWHTEANFLNLYAMSCLYGHKTWLVEQKLDIFRYFIDLDFKQPGILLPQKIEAVVFIVIRALSKFFRDSPPDLLKCICSSTVCKVDRCKACLCDCQGQKDCEECKGVGNTGRKGALACPGCGGEFPVTKKTGVHLHFPNIFVTAAQALDMRETVIAECSRVWGFRSGPLNSWGEVIDEVVYKQSGLRMMCANKGDPCKQCKSQKAGEVCGMCRNSRRIDQGRPYFPLACFNGNGLRDKGMEMEYETNFSKLIQDTTIRYYGETVTQGYELYDGAPTSATSFKAKIQGTKQAGKKRVLSETSGAMLSHQLSMDAPEVRAIQSFFSAQSVADKHCPSQYGDLVVSQVKYKKKDESYKVDVSGRNSRYCMNKGENHGGNRIYFLFQSSAKDHPQGVVQKCYCLKEEVRKYGTCAAYVSSPMTMPHKIASLLFNSEGAGKDEQSVLTRMDFRGMTREARSQNQLLLNAGNLLCKELFNTLWTSSPRFCSMFGSSMLEQPLPKKLSMYRPFKMDSVGPDDEKTLEDLGFQRQRKVTEEEILSPKERPVKKGLEFIEKRINSIITNILNAALHMEEEKVLDTLSSGTLNDLAKGVPEAPDFELEKCLISYTREFDRIRKLHADISGTHVKERSKEEQKEKCKEVCETMRTTLIALLRYRHDESMENSHRHQGLGWSAEVVGVKFRDKAKEVLKEIQS